MTLLIDSEKLKVVNIVYFTISISDILTSNCSKITLKIFCVQTEKTMGIWSLYRSRNQELFQRKYISTFFPDPPHHPHNHRDISTDTQEETVNTPANLLPY